MRIALIGGVRAGGSGPYVVIVSRKLRIDPPITSVIVEGGALSLMRLLFLLGGLQTLQPPLNDAARFGTLFEVLQQCCPQPSCFTWVFALGLAEAHKIKRFGILVLGFEDTAVKVERPIRYGCVRRGLLQDCAGK